MGTGNRGIVPICAAHMSRRDSGRNGQQLTEDLLDVLVDCEARAALEVAGLSLLAGRHPRRTVAEDWLRALSSQTWPDRASRRRRT